MEEEEYFPEDKIQRLQGELENLKIQLMQAHSQVTDLTLHLEVANERWVQTVNENASLQVQLRKETRNGRI